jgi:High potential iron-sulfur protein
MNDASRRRLVQRLAALAGVAVIAPIRARSAELVRLDVNDPAARALGYVENAARVDVRKFPSYVKGSNCENCLQLGGTAGNNYRPCALFPGKSVSVSGWCSGWAAEM